MASERLIEALASTAEICNARWSEPTKVAVVRMLEPYPEPAVLKALHRCCLELKTLSVADILARIEDGRPGVEEAWALLPRSEDESIVWTDEMAEANAVSRLLEDPVAARMAFREKYLALVADARRDRKPTRWTPSLGHDRKGQEVALKEAVDRGRLTAQQAAALLPNGIAEPGRGLLMIGTDLPADGVQTVEKTRKLARQILKDAPIEKQAVEALRQNGPIEGHEGRVLKQLEKLKKEGGS